MPLHHFDPPRGRIETLAIDLRELIVLERNFADVAPDVIVLSRPVLGGQ